MLSIYFRSLVLRQCCIDGHSANQYVQIKVALWSHSGYDAEQQERRAGRVGLPPPGGLQYNRRCTGTLSTLYCPNARKSQPLFIAPLLVPHPRQIASSAVSERGYYRMAWPHHLGYLNRSSHIQG